MNWDILFQCPCPPGRIKSRHKAALGTLLNAHIRFYMVVTPSTGMPTPGLLLIPSSPRRLSESHSSRLGRPT